MLEAQTKAVARQVAGAQQGIQEVLVRGLKRGGGSDGVKGDGLEAIEAGMEALAKDVKEAVDARAAIGGGSAAVFEQFDDRVRVLQDDLERARRAQRQSAGLAVGLVVLFMAPVLLGVGLAAQQQLSVLPEPDPTGGWRSYVWDRYGEDIIACERTADQAGAVVRCELAVGNRR